MNNFNIPAVPAVTKDTIIDNSETGWVSGGFFVMTSPASSDIEISTEMVVRKVDRINRTIEYATIPAGTIVPTEMGPGEVKYLFVDISDGSPVYHWIVYPTGADRRKMAQVGRVWMDGVGNVSGVADSVDPAWDLGESFKETMYLSNICRVASGNTYSLHGTNMTMQKSLGSDFKMGVYAKEYIAGTNYSPNQGVEPAVAEFPVMLLIRRDLVTVDYLTEIPTTQYELDGVLTDFSDPNKYGFMLVIHAIKANLCILQYGQEEFNSLQAAMEGFNEDEYIYSLGVKNLGPIKGIIAFKNGVTDITSSDIEFVEMNFVPGIGVGGGVGTTLWTKDGTDLSPITPSDNIKLESLQINTITAPEIGQVWSTKDIEGLGEWGDVLKSETEFFSSFNAKFLGELGLPEDQGWTDAVTTPATIELVQEVVFGINKQVVKHNDNGSGLTTSKKPLTAQYWLEIEADGTSFGGVSRLDTYNGSSGFFIGLQADAPENPLDAEDRRYGLVFNESGGYLRAAEVSGGNIVLDGTGGNPLVLFDEYFKYEVVVVPGLGASVLFINGMETTLTLLFRVNAGGKGTQAIVSCGSSGGVDRVAYHSEFGVTIYTESNIKIIATKTMQAGIATFIIPPGKRDYIIKVPTGHPRNIGDTAILNAANVGGKIMLTNEDVNNPEALFNGLATIEFDIDSQIDIHATNTVNQSNIYDVAPFDSLVEADGTVNIKNNPLVIELTAGEDLEVGNIVKIGSADLTVIKTTTVEEEAILGVVETIALNGNPVKISRGGIIVVKITGSVTRGDFLVTSIVSGTAISSGTGGGQGDFAIALENGTDSTIQALYTKTEIF